MNITITMPLWQLGLTCLLLVLSGVAIHWFGQMVVPDRRAHPPAPPGPAPENNRGMDAQLALALGLIVLGITGLASLALIVTALHH